MRAMLWALHFTEYASLLAAALQQKAEVLLVVYSDNAANELGQDFRQQINGVGVMLEVLERPRTPIDILRNSMRLLAISKRFRPDVLHIQEDGRDEMLLALFGLGKVPVVLTVHDPVPHSGRDALRFRFSRGRLYLMLLRRRADSAITHGIALSKALARVAPRLSDRTCVIPHGPLGLFRIKPTENHRLGTPAILLFFGRIHAYKGLRYFVEAVRTLHEQGVKVLGIVAGRGSDLDQYRDEMLAAGCFEIRDRYIDAKEVVELFRQSDLVVLPYTDATQSGVAAMALGYGIPVIATAVGSIPEFVRHDFNGRLVPRKDVTALVQAIQQVLDKPGEYERLSHNAIDLRDGELSWHHIAELTMRCYHETCTTVQGKKH